MAYKIEAKATQGEQIKKKIIMAKLAEISL